MIKISLYLYIIALAILLFVSIGIVMGYFYPKMVFLLSSFSLSTIMAVLVIREYSRLKVASLIIENQIIQISPTRFISCFGILLGSKIIKFNQAGIKLMTVEIGLATISLRYGRDNKVNKITLPFEKLDEKEIVDIIQKFSYETGIRPTMIT